MIRFDSFSIGYKDRTLVRDANAMIPDGCFTALLGRNGSGKSTVLSAVCGAKRDYSGTISVGGVDVKSIPQYRLAMSVSFVSTERVRIPGMTCLELVSLGRAPYTGWAGRLSSKDRNIVLRALETVGMEGFAGRTMEKMSDGECQRVMIARALAQDTPVMLLDEPTSFLDYPNRRELCMLLAGLAHEAGKTVLFSTHELPLALEMCDSALLIDGGEMEYMPVGDMCHSGKIEKVFGYPAGTMQRNCKF